MLFVRFKQSNKSILYLQTEAQLPIKKIPGFSPKICYPMESTQINKFLLLMLASVMIHSGAKLRSKFTFSLTGYDSRQRCAPLAPGQKNPQNYLKEKSIFMSSRRSLCMVYVKLRVKKQKIPSIE